jgi:hypothetical protein
MDFPNSVGMVIYSDNVDPRYNRTLLFYDDVDGKYRICITSSLVTTVKLSPVDSGETLVSIMKSGEFFKLIKSMGIPEWYKEGKDEI